MIPVRKSQNESNCFKCPESRKKGSITSQASHYRRAHESPLSPFPLVFQARDSLIKPDIKWLERTTQVMREGKAMSTIEDQRSNNNSRNGVSCGQSCSLHTSDSATFFIPTQFRRNF